MPPVYFNSSDRSHPCELPGGRALSPFSFVLFHAPRSSEFAFNQGARSRTSLTNPSSSFRRNDSSNLASRVVRFLFLLTILKPSTKIQYEIDEVLCLRVRHMSYFVFIHLCH